MISSPTTQSYKLMEFDYLKIILPESKEALQLRGSDNCQLINNENIFSLYPAINKHNVHLTTVCSVHITKDIFINDVPDFISKIGKVPFGSLEVLHFTERNKEGTKNGLVIKSKARKRLKGANIYLTIYDKFAQSKDEKYRNILRLELKISGFQSLRTKFSIHQNDLFSVLMAEVNPLEKLVQNIYADINKDKMKNTPLTNELDLFKWHTYFQYFDYDFSKIRNHLKISNESSYKIRKVKEHFTHLTELKQNTDFESLFSQLLKQSQSQSIAA